ncbi:hypothetical protein BDN70DRAFT_874394 [Pholiota conissans]|uniref:Uncharacterized protein n=1 Tax=Pholiota conissans TaxID=109636 RepID=A0A9P6D4U9_9AGAR|nr:hypothetical protein BDN70DRAFT_874394 [Pholiota conissans]
MNEEFLNLDKLHPGTADQILDIEATLSSSKYNAEKHTTTSVLDSGLTHKETLTLRIRPMDNIRTIALSLIVLQHIAVEIVYMHLAADEPNTPAYTFLNIFVGLSKILAVPLLFFVAGFTAHFTMTVHEIPPFDFLVVRTWKTVLLVALYQGTSYLAVRRWSLFWRAKMSTWIGPYYDVREGMEALLNGTTTYVLATLVMDYLYAILRSKRVFAFGENNPNHFITTKYRYEIAKGILFSSVSLWVYACGSGYAEPFLPQNSTLEELLYACNSAELHFPILFLVAYFAGTQFLHYRKFIVDADHSSHFSPSPLRTLLLSLAFSVCGLWYFCYTFPEGDAFLDVRLRPFLQFHDHDTAAAYAIWVLVILSTIPEALLKVCLTHPRFTGDWGVFSRHPYFQVHMQTLVLLVNRSDYKLAAVYIIGGFMSMVFVYISAIMGFAFHVLALRGWRMFKL